MKKSIVFLLTVMTMALYACGDMDDCSINTKIDTTAYISNNGLQEVSLSGLTSNAYQVCIYKAGYNGETVKLDLAVADSLITQYNEKNATSYTLLPAQYYTVGNGVSLNNVHYQDSIAITFNATAITADNIGNGNVLPLVLIGVAEKNLSQAYKSILIHVSK